MSQPRRPSPVRRFTARLAIRSTRSSAISPTATTAEIAMQRSPAEPNPALIAWSAARSRAAPGRTTMWSFAPPRAWTRLPCAFPVLYTYRAIQGRTHEGDRLHVRAGQQRVDGSLVAVEDVDEHAVGQPRLLPQLRDPQRGGGNLLRRLEYHLGTVAGKLKGETIATSQSG